MEKWKIGMYLRLSLEDRDIHGKLKEESDSIAGQRKLIQSFIKKTPAFSEAEVVEFCDDGYTGTSTNRPDFQRMIQMARTGEVNCIIVKDLSRFGRNYLDVGHYIEKVLPFLRVRFISINDVYDSADIRRKTLDVSFKNLLNDLYSRDVSVKVKNGKRIVAMQGKFQSPWAPYGYVKSAKDKRKLEIDPEAAQVVRRIFSLFLEGNGTVGIAKILNREFVPTRSAYKYHKGEKMRWQYSGNKNYWTSSGVHYILTDKHYVGSIVHGRLMAKGLATHRTVKAPEEDLIVVENCHEPIISQVDFDRAQSMIHKQGHYERTGRPLTGKIKCGICGHAMPLRQAKQPYLVCGTKWYASNYSCSEMRYILDDIYSLLLKSLQQQVQAAVELEVIAKAKCPKGKDTKTQLSKQLIEQESAMDKWKKTIRESFERFSKGEISEQEFIILQREGKEKQAEIAEEIQGLKEQIAALVEAGRGRLHFISEVKFSASEITVEMLDSFIEEVRLYPDDSMQINWSFADDYVRLLEQFSQENVLFRKRQTA